MYKGLGLDTLKCEKEHFNVYVHKLPSVPVSEEVQKYIQFGTDNEINAITTLVGLLMPALLPSCFSFFEVGPQFIHGVHKENLIEVSVDGIIRCTHGASCMFKQTQSHCHKKIVVEAKCVCPSDDMLKFPYYKLPVRHVPQCLCELIAYDADELWLISFTLYSVTFIVVYFDEKLWQKLLNLTKEKYDMVRPVLPTRLHLQSRKLRAD